MRRRKSFNDNQLFKVCYKGIRSWKLYSFLVGLMATVLLSLPLSFQKREIMPYGMHRIADFNHQAIVPVGENIVFNIAISGDLQLLHKPIFAEDLFDKVLMQSIPEKAINKPGLLFKKLGFKLATYQQKTVNAQV